MAWLANDSQAARREGVPQSVAKEFVAADKKAASRSEKAKKRYGGKK